MLEVVDLARRQIPEGAQLERGVGERAEPHPLQPDNGVAHGLAHVPHLARPSLVQHKRQHRLVVSRAEAGIDQLHLSGGRAPPLNHESTPKPIDGMPVWCAPDPSVVLPFHFVSRVQQALGQFAVIRQDQQAFRIEVQPPDRVDVAGHPLQQIQHRWTMLRIGAGGDVPARLVQQQIPPLLRDPDPGAIHTDVVGGRVCLLAEFENRAAVHGDASLCDERL